MTPTLTTNPLNHMITEVKSKTLQAVHLLRQVNFSEAQAEVIADLIEQKSFEAVQIAEQKVDQKIKSNEERQAKDLESVSTKGDIQTLKNDIHNLELKIEKIRADLEVKIEKSKSETIRWVVGMATAQIGVLLATLTKVLN